MSKVLALILAALLVGCLSVPMERQRRQTEAEPEHKEDQVSESSSDSTPQKYDLKPEEYQQKDEPKEPAVELQPESKYESEELKKESKRDSDDYGNQEAAETDPPAETPKEEPKKYEEAEDADSELNAAPQGGNGLLDNLGGGGDIFSTLQSMLTTIQGLGRSLQFLQSITSLFNLGGAGGGGGGGRH